MVKACIKLLITGIILMIVGMIGVSVLWVNGYEDVFSLPVRHRSSDTAVEVVDNGYYDDGTFSILDMKYADTVNKLDINVKAGTFTILSGDTLSISGTDINTECLDYSIENGVLYVSYSPEFYFFNFDFDADDATIFITIPPKVFETANFSATAGELNVADLEVKRLSVDLMAGEHFFTNVYAEDSAQIKMAAGECTFENCNFNNANIKMTAGQMNYNYCKIAGENRINMTAGDLYMELIGKRSDYKWSVDRTAGGVYIDGDYVYGGEYAYSATTYETVVTEETVTEQSEVSVREKVDENGQNSIDIDLTAGECYISFYDE